jgi:hypothetical protein
MPVSCPAMANRCEGGDRDEAIREEAAGLSFSSIQTITGLGKTTIMRILNHRLRP